MQQDCYCLVARFLEDCLMTAWVPLYLLQGGTVMWDARGDHYNQAALELPKHQFDAIRCSLTYVPLMHMSIQPCTVSMLHCSNWSMTSCFMHALNCHQAVEWPYLGLTLWLVMCRDDKVDQLLTLFENVAPNLPSCARTASTDLVRHKANFRPVPSWTYLSQMHGPKVLTMPFT